MKKMAALIVVLMLAGGSVAIAEEYVGKAFPTELVFKSLERTYKDYRQGVPGRIVGKVQDGDRYVVYYKPSETNGVWRFPIAVTVLHLDTDKWIVFGLLGDKGIVVGGVDDK